MFNICQYCSTYASIALSCLSEMPAAVVSLLAFASMLPVPLTVLLRSEFVTHIRLLSTTATGPCAPGKGGQHRLHEPVHESVPRPRDRRAVHLRLKLDYALPYQIFKRLEQPPAEYVFLACKGLRPVEVELYIRCS